MYSPFLCKLIYYYDNQMEKDKMGAPSTVHEGHKEYISKFGWKAPHADLVIDGRLILKLILWKQGCSVWIGLIWLRIGSGGRLLCIQ
jgi:hypothetical protein